MLVLLMRKAHGRGNLVPIKKQVARGGKSFMQTVWVSPEKARGRITGAALQNPDTKKKTKERSNIGDTLAEAKRQYEEVESRYKGTPQWMIEPNGKPTNLNERQWVQVRTPLFKEYFGDWETLTKRELLDDMQAISLNDKSLDNLDIKALREKTKGIYSRFNPIETADGKTVKFTPVGFKEVKSHSADKKVLLLLSKADSVLKNAIPLFSENHTKASAQDSIKAWHYYGAKVSLTVDGKAQDFYARMVVREDANGNIYYDNDLTSIESISGSEHVSPANPGAYSQAAYKHSIGAWYNSVNPAEVSKVVDENGAPLVVAGMFVKSENPNIGKIPKMWELAYSEGRKAGEKYGENHNAFYTDSAYNFDETGVSKELELYLNDYSESTNIRNIQSIFNLGLEGRPFPEFVFAERIGTTPERERSANFRDNEYERGVSVLGIVDPEKGTVKENNGTFEMFNDGEHFYIGGFELPFSGSDGEPLLIGIQHQSGTKEARIKSATGNAGTFSGKTWNINKSIALLYNREKGQYIFKRIRRGV